MKINYYFIHIKEDDIGGVAQSSGSSTLADIMNKIIDTNRLPSSLVVNKGVLQDYLANDLGLPLMSQRFKDIISSELSGFETLSWGNAKINYEGKMYDYYIPYFKNNLDVLDTNKTIFSGPKRDFIVKAHLSIDKIKSYHFFALPDLPFTRRLIVTEDIKKKIEAAGLTGIDFSRAQAS